VADPQHLPQPVVIALPAEIDMANAGQVGHQLGSALAPGVKTVIAGMTATTLCDSSGISIPSAFCTVLVVTRCSAARAALGGSSPRREVPDWFWAPRQAASCHEGGCATRAGRLAGGQHHT
jgi:hypothetical protein